MQFSFEPHLVEDQANPGLYHSHFRFSKSGMPPRQLKYADYERLHQLGPDAWRRFPYLVRRDLRIYGEIRRFEERGHSRESSICWISALLAVDTEPSIAAAAAASARRGTGGR